MADSTQRDKVRNHLEAAREWLGSASGALEQREDIKSELDIMLAEAELARAREMKNAPEGEKGLRRRANLLRQVMRLAPLAAALAIAAMWLRFSAVTLPVKPTPPAPPVVAKPQIPQGAKPAKAEPEAPAEEKPGYTAGPPMGREERTEGQPSAPVPEEATEGKQPPDSGENAESAEDNGASQPERGPGTIPDSSTQQMMLDAAKILRQAK